MSTLDMILTEISPLETVEKLKLVDEILNSLHKPDAKIDSFWKAEVENRIDAYNSGKISTVSEEEVFQKYSKSCHKNY